MSRMEGINHWNLAVLIVFSCRCAKSLSDNCSLELLSDSTRQVFNESRIQLTGIHKLSAGTKERFRGESRSRISLESLECLPF